MSTTKQLQHQQTQQQISKRSPSPTPPLNKKPKSQPLNMSNRKRKHEEILNTSQTNASNPTTNSSTTNNTNLKENGNSNDTDLTKHMDAPLAQPHVEEVHIPKNVNIKKESTDYQPYRNGTLIDLDEENNQNNNEENKDPSVYMNGHNQINGKFISN